MITFRHLDSNQDNGLQRTAGCRLPNAGLWLQPVSGSLWSAAANCRHHDTGQSESAARSYAAAITADAQPSILIARPRRFCISSGVLMLRILVRWTDIRAGVSRGGRREADGTFR